MAEIKVKVGVRVRVAGATEVWAVELMRQVGCPDIGDEEGRTREIAWLSGLASRLEATPFAEMGQSQWGTAEVMCLGGC